MALGRPQISRYHRRFPDQSLPGPPGTDSRHLPPRPLHWQLVGLGSCGPIHEYSVVFLKGTEIYHSVNK